ncbi:hypothetical protein JZ751_023593 [Albula glossodonta]|uniref:Uncharacterized protein n=1 Tax=Albula glossodonta TaxID=121402 RepID=A0A8T2NGE6_9TELE|nr:hypothetical protein JZ751_023593 [Albula glossodonta]
MTYCQGTEQCDALDFESESRRGGRTVSEMGEAIGFPVHCAKAQPQSQPPTVEVDRQGCSAALSPSHTGTGGCHGEENRIPNRLMSQEVDIPCLSKPIGEAFLVPSSCKSICKDYNDLLIGGDLVMPLSVSAGHMGVATGDNLADGPFLQSCEIPPATMDSPQASPESPRKPLRGDSSRWRGGSGKDRSFLLNGGRPLSNSQLNEYLEQKLKDLYRQYMGENMVLQGSPSAVLASELILTSVDQITLQLSREQNLEAAKAKDMVLSCLLRVTSERLSGEISTPQLQISEDLA